MSLLRRLDLGHVRLTGKDRVRFLQGMFTADVAALTTGQGSDAAMLTAKGKTVAVVELLVEEGAIDLRCVASLVGKLVPAMDRYLIADDVQIDDRSATLGALGLFDAAGEGSGSSTESDAASLLAGSLSVEPAALRALAPHSHVRAGALRIARTVELSPRAEGFRVDGPRADVEALATKLTAATSPLDGTGYEVLRVEAGRPLYGVDVDEERMPVEARLDAAISHTKGCYVGQETIVRLRDQGHLNWRLMGLRLDGDGPAPRGAKLATGTRPDAGHVTSSVVSPRLGAIALAYVHRSTFAPGTEVTVDGRRARVVDLPF